jgi:hypothetical protein
MLDNALSVDDYNKILANHYKFEVSIDEWVYFKNY